MTLFKIYFQNFERMKSQNQNNNVIEKKICDKNKKVRNFLLYFLKILGVFYQAISRVVVLALTKNWHDFILAIVDMRHIIFFDWRPASPILGISKQAEKSHCNRRDPKTRCNQRDIMRLV